MNKKLFALLLVSAFALQLKAADPAGGTTNDLSDSTTMGARPKDRDYSDVDDSDVDDDDESDTDEENQEIPTTDKGAAAGAGAGINASDNDDNDVKVDPAKTTLSEEPPTGDDFLFGAVDTHSALPGAAPSAAPAGTPPSAISSAALGAAPAGTTPPHRPRSSRAVRGAGNGGAGARFVMPEANDNIVKGLLKRCLGKVWTTGSEDIEAILTYGAKNYGQMNHAEKAAYFNAQDAQWGLRTSRALKVARLLIVATFAKIMKDVLNATEDDEDEDDVAYTA